MEDYSLPEAVHIGWIYVQPSFVYLHRCYILTVRALFLWNARPGRWTHCFPSPVIGGQLWISRRYWPRMELPAGKQRVLPSCSVSCPIYAGWVSNVWRMDAPLAAVFSQALGQKTGHTMRMASRTAESPWTRHNDSNKTLKCIKACNTVIAWPGLYLK
jgi:hypothetical protein